MPPTRKINMNTKPFVPYTDIEFSRLCRDIDQLRVDLEDAEKRAKEWEQRAKEWEQRAKEWEQRYHERIQRDLAHSQRMAIGMLDLAMATVPSPDPAARK